MTVLHIITGLNDGGAEAVLARLCMHDAEYRHVVVAMMDQGKYGPLLQAVGIEVYCLGMPRGRVTVGALLRLWRLLRKKRPDLVQTWMYHADLIGGVLAKIAGVPRICWGVRHTSFEPGKSRRSTMAIARLNARLSRWLPHTIVCCAEKAREVHVASGFEASRCVVIPNGYDLDHFRPDDAARQRLRGQWGIAETTPLLGMVARFDPQKDHENLLHALLLLKRSRRRLRCALVGWGMTSDNAQLGAWLDHHGLHDEVLLLGQRNDIPAVMSALDVHVLSSPFGEAFPNVVAEAMACGTPCVTTDVGDAARIVGDTGWVVPARNAGLLAQAIDAALTDLNNSEAWQARCALARDRVSERYSLPGMISAYHAVWRGNKEAGPNAP